MTDSINSFDVFRKFFTKLNEFSKKSIELEFNSNEAFTKEQLIVPVIHELGYITEADDNMRLDLWPEVINHDNNFVDYAIQLNEKQANIPAHTHILIEAKAMKADLSKATKEDKKVPVKQLSGYFNDKSVNKTVLLGILTNGVEWRLYKSENDSNFMDETPFFTVKLEELANDTNKLDAFFNYASKKTITECISNDNSKEAFKKHINDEIIKSGLRQEVAFMLSTPKDDFFKRLDNCLKDCDKNYQYIQQIFANRNLPIPNFKGKDGNKKKEKFYTTWSNYMKDIYNQLSSNNTTIDDAQNIHSPQQNEVNPKDFEITTTSIEVEILNTIQKILNDNNIRCTIKHVDQKKFINYVISDLSQEDLDNQCKGKNTTKNSPYNWVVRFGNDRKYNEFSDYAQFKIENGCIAFNLDGISQDALAEFKQHIPDKFKLNAGVSNELGGVGPYISSIHTLSDIMELSAAIAFCFKYQLNLKHTC